MPINHNENDFNNKNSSSPFSLPQEISQFFMLDSRNRSFRLFTLISFSFPIFLSFVIIITCVHFHLLGRRRDIFSFISKINTRWLTQRVINVLCSSFEYQEFKKTILPNRIKQMDKFLFCFALELGANIIGLWHLINAIGWMVYLVYVLHTFIISREYYLFFKWILSELKNEKSINGDVNNRASTCAKIQGFTVRENCEFI